MSSDDSQGRSKKSETIKAVRVRVTGRVQKVGYRAWVAKEAQARSLAGWVKNRADGSVEALLCGPESKVDSMITACHVGPPACKVQKVRVFPNAEVVKERTFAIMSSS